VAISAAVRRYYAENIFAKSSRDAPPPNFRPLEVPATGFTLVEGCRGGGKNILEVYVRGEGDALRDIRIACGLCNPAMYACADVVVNWARGRRLDEVLVLNPFDVRQLIPFWDALGGPGRPDDAREKFQYTILAVQNAIRNHRGEKPPPVPPIPEATEHDWAQGDPEAAS
jgi:hypothetical protein